MPAPLAKGLIIGLSVVIAAGIAANENPQVRAWVEQQRRKLAEFLHQLGDNIAPQPQRQQVRSWDMSMTEDNSDAAEQRRRAVREEIRLRQEILEQQARARREASQRKSSETESIRAQRASGSFDTLVDENGVLRVDKALGVSTATDTAAEGLVNRRDRQTQDAAFDARSVTLGPATPRSEFADPDISVPGEAPTLSQSEYFSSPTSPDSSSENGFFYAAPPQTHQSPADLNTPVSSPFADPVPISTANSIAGSLDHMDDALSVDDGVESIADEHDIFTPTTWSEVGSVISGSERGDF